MKKNLKLQKIMPEILPQKIKVEWNWSLNSKDHKPIDFKDVEIFTPIRVWALKETTKQNMRIKDMVIRTVFSQKQEKVSQALYLFRVNKWCVGMVTEVFKYSKRDKTKKKWMLTLRFLQESSTAAILENQWTFNPLKDNNHL